MGEAYFGRKRRDGLSSVRRHMDALPVPGRLVVRVHAQSGPHILRPLGGLLRREGAFDNDVPVLQEMVHLLLCPVPYRRQPNRDSISVSIFEKYPGERCLRVRCSYFAPMMAASDERLQRYHAKVRTGRVQNGLQNRVVSAPDVQTSMIIWPCGRSSGSHKVSGPVVRSQLARFPHTSAKNNLRVVDVGKRGAPTITWEGQIWVL